MAVAAALASENKSPSSSSSLKSPRVLPPFTDSVGLIELEGYLYEWKREKGERRGRGRGGGIEGREEKERGGSGGEVETKTERGYNV